MQNGVICSICGALGPPFLALIFPKSALASLWSNYPWRIINFCFWKCLILVRKGAFVWLRHAVSLAFRHRRSDRLFNEFRGDFDHLKCIRADLVVAPRDPVVGGVNRGLQDSRFDCFCPRTSRSGEICLPNWIVDAGWCRDSFLVPFARNDCYFSQHNVTSMAAQQHMCERSTVAECGQRWNVFKFDSR